MSEYLHVEKPFLDQLAALGWTVIDQGHGLIPSDPAKSLRTSFREVLLPEVFRSAVSALNRTSDGAPWLTSRQLDDLRDQLLRQPSRTLAGGQRGGAGAALQGAGGRERGHRRIAARGASDRLRPSGAKRVSRDQPVPHRNARRCEDFIIPDIVLFVNGIPLVVIEAKIGDANTANPMYEAGEQLLRYRNGRPATQAAGLREGDPRLFYSNLLLIRTCGETAQLGTITSGHEHFYAWKDIWPESRQTYTPPLGIEREQERLIQGLLAPDTLLDVLRTCSVFMETDDGKRIKVVARYQQYRAARRILRRLRTGQTPDERSGVVWHTQGSGKSLTMVFVARMIRASADLADFKIVLVNDRVDLEEQLTDTARLIGGKINVIESTDNLREHLSTDASDVNMVMVHKFTERTERLPPVVEEALAAYGAPPTAATFGEVNASPRILLMIDEAHRTQGSDLGDNVFEAFPHATRIAFTGTPLITEKHGARRTVKRFGDYIDTYKLMDAVHDGATLQILYEGRTADTALKDKAGFEQKFEDLFRQRSPEQIEAIKKKYGASGDLLEAEKRIGAIARDLVAHYLDNILPDGFKAQVVCHSKLAAVRYQKAIREALVERLARKTSSPRPTWS
jgi:type I restriction enzyme R subunit